MEKWNVYKRTRPIKKSLSVMEFLTQNNPEIWRKCIICGQTWDGKKTGLHCTLCNTEGIVINKK